MRKAFLSCLILLVLVFAAFAHAREYSGWKAEVENLILAGKYAQAQEKLKAAELAGNQDADFYFLRAKARTGAGHFDGSLADLGIALEKDPKFVEALGHKAVVELNLGRPQDSIKSAAAALAIEPSADLYYIQGAANMVMGKLDDALSDLNNALVLEPTRSDFYIDRGEVQVRRRQYTKAKKDYEKAIELDPKNPRAYLGRGGLRLLIGDKAGALKDLERCISLDPYFGLGYLRRGKYWEMANDAKKAVADYTKATELLPTSDEAWFERTMAELGSGQFEAAQKSAEKLMAVSNNQGRAHKVLGTVLAARGKAPEAISEYGKAIGINPKDAEALLYRGRVYALSNNPDEALKDFDRVIALVPGLVDPYLDKAEVFLVKKQADKALEVYNQWLGKRPNDIRMLERRQALYKDMGRFDEALADLRRIRELKSAQNAGSESDAQ